MMIGNKFRWWALVWSCILWVGLSLPLLAQNRAEIEKQRKKAQRDIELTNQLIKQKQKERKVGLNKLELINSQIRSREKIITNVNREIELQQHEIAYREQKITKLNRDLDKLKGEYARMVYHAYRNRQSYDVLMFLLSSNDFNQAYRRLKYLQQYSEYRKKQAFLIEKTRKQIGGEVARISEVKAQKEGMKVLNLEEKKKLSGEKVQQSKVVAQLKSEEQRLRNELREKEAVSRKLQAAIEEIIREEARKLAEENARKAAAEAARLKSEKSKATGSSGTAPAPAREKAKPSTNYSLTPEETMISSGLGANKGRLVWPTERGVITSRFGKHPHPVIQSVQVNNNGVDIATTEGSEVRAVYQGEVREVISIPGGNGAVIIRHGNFLTVYQNLRGICVKKGQKVTAKQKIGVVCTEGGDDPRSILHFEIWKETAKMDPESWLSKH